MESDNKPAPSVRLGHCQFTLLLIEDNYTSISRLCQEQPTRDDPFLRRRKKGEGENHSPDSQEPTSTNFLRVEPN